MIIPESISGFGQALDTDIIERVQLLTGALPAQYGYRTAGVVDITTESGGHPHGEEASDSDLIGGKIGVLGGSYGTLNPEISLHGSADRFSYFFTGEFLRSDIGIECRDPRIERAVSSRATTIGFSAGSRTIEVQGICEECATHREANTAARSRQTIMSLFR